MELCLLYATFPTLETARTAAQALLNSHLVACVNILPGMVSLYQWQGHMQENAEVVMIAKTTRDQYISAQEWLAEQHPHECPCILQIPVTQAHAAFLAWVQDETHHV